MKTSIKKTYISFFVFCLSALHFMAINAAPLSQAQDDVRAQLATLAKGGYGFLERIRNSTKYPCDIYFIKDKPEDFLPEETTIRIKSIADGKYYSYRQQADKTFPCKADTTDPKDRNTLFAIRKGIAPNLTPRISLSPVDDPKKFLTFDPDSKLLKIEVIDYASEDNKQCHWEIVSSYVNAPEKIDKVYLKNNASDGCLTTYRGKETVRLEPDSVKEEKMDAVWKLSHWSLPDSSALQNTLISNYTFSSDKISGSWSASRKADSLFVQLSIKDNDNAWAVTVNGGLFCWNGNSWVEEKLGMAQTCVSIADDGTVCSLGGDNIIRTKTPKGWVEVANDKKWTMMSVRNKDEVWGIDAGDKQIYKLTNQQTRTQVPLPGTAINLSVTHRGEVWAINATNQVYRLEGNDWLLVPGIKLMQLSVCDNNEVWGIGIDGKLYKWEGTNWGKIEATEPTWASNITSAKYGGRRKLGYRKWNYGGAHWDDQYDTYYDDVTKKLQNLVTQQVTEGKTTFSFEKSYNDLFGDPCPGQAKTLNITFSNGKSVSLKENQSFSIKLSSFIAVSNSTKKTIIPGRTEIRDVEGASTVGVDGKPAVVGDASAVAIEVEKLGMGGGLAPQTTSDYVAIPVKKNPKVSGFAETEFTNFTAGSTLNLIPLLSKGTAWLQTSVTPGKTTLSFMAMAGDDGGIEVVFGQDISTNFVWKVIIGGWKNTKSGIIKRSIVNNQPVETLVAQVLPKEDPTTPTISINPLARALPGQVVPYWVTIEDGLILVGSGNPGENIFLAWRDPNPPDDVNRIGLASDTKPVQFANVQIQAPMIVDRPSRAYAVIGGSISPTTDIAWSKYLFRVNDRAALSMDISGKQQVAVALGGDENPAKGNYYQVVFGYDNNEGIAIQKWIASEKKLKTISSISKKSYPDVALDSTNAKPFWISYEFGQIMVGQGAIGENLILCTKDIAPLQNIRTLGFSAASGQSAVISNFKIYPPTSLILQGSAQSYKTPSQQAVDFAGNLTIIFPFEYQFSQTEQAVKMEDLVNHVSFYVGATPQQGSLYKFMLTLDPSGTPKLDLTEAPDDEKLKSVQESLLKGQADIDLQRVKADQIAKAGDLNKQLVYAAAAHDRNESSAKMQTAQFYQQVGAGIASSAGFSNKKSLFITGVGMGSALALSGLAYAFPAQKLLEEAGGKELKGEEASVAANANAIAAAANADKMDIQQKLLMGQAQFSFRSSDSYVYIDQANREALGNVTVSADALANRDEAAALLASLRQPTMDEFASYISTLQKVILDITHFKVVEAKSTRDLIYSYIQTMYLAYTKQFFADPSTRPPAINAQVINILMTAYNNTFLVNQANANEAATKKTWNTWMNELARDFIAQPNIDIDLEPMFGEYIWHPQPIVNNKVTLTFQAKANNDIFICFSPVNHAVRNTDTELYEIDLGGWDDTKSVIRIKSLDHSAKEVTTDDLLNTLDYKSYWVTLDNGQINVGTGDNPNDKKSVFLSWTDPYPNRVTPMKYIGFSCWNSAITLKNINISGAAGKLAPIVAPSAPQPEQQEPGVSDQAPVEDIVQQAPVEGKQETPVVVPEVPAKVAAPVKKTIVKKSKPSTTKIVPSAKKRTPPQKNKLKGTKMRPKPKPKNDIDSVMPLA